MENKLTLRYFKIERCGYWSQSKKEPNHFEDLQLMLSHLEEYVQDKTIEETGIGCGEQDPKTFLLDIRHQDGLWLLAFWNPSEKGPADEIVSLNIKSKLGKADSAPVHAGKGKSFGFVSYFLIWPDYRFYATVMPSGATLAGRVEFEQYMRHFLWIAPNFVTTELQEKRSEDGSTHTIEKQNFQLPIPLHGKPLPYFSAKLAKSPSEKDYVLKNYNKVVQVHNRCTVRVTRGQSSQSILRRISIGLFGRTELFAPLDTIRINHSVSAAFSNKENLLAWIKEWEENSADFDRDDCGFKLEGEEKIYWLRGNMLKCELATENLHKENGIYPAEEILAFIQKRKNTVLAEFQLSDDT